MTRIPGARRCSEAAGCSGSTGASAPFSRDTASCPTLYSDTFVRLEPPRDLVFLAPITSARADLHRRGAALRHHHAAVPAAQSPAHFAHHWGIAFLHSAVPQSEKFWRSPPGGQYPSRAASHV